MFETVLFPIDNSRQASETAAVALKPTDAASFGKAFGMVTANCKSCHEGFRIKKS